MKIVQRSCSAKKTMRTKRKRFVYITLSSRNPIVENNFCQSIKYTTENEKYEKRTAAFGKRKEEFI